MHWYIFKQIVLLATLLLTATTTAQTWAGSQKPMPADRRLERCVYLHDKIERYTGLRRAGGSAVRMESWRRSRQRYAIEFRELRCHRLSRQIRRRSEKNGGAGDRGGSHAER